MLGDEKPVTRDQIKALLCEKIRLNTAEGGRGSSIGIGLVLMGESIHDGLYSVAKAILRLERTD